MIEYVVIILAAFCGFILAFYISTNKRKKKKMVCPLKGNCSSVVHSKYSKFFGVSVEYLGMLYYAAIAIGYVTLTALPSSQMPLLLYGLLIASGFAFLFSVYLTFIQIFTLRQMCTWCITSALLSTIIFIVGFVYSSPEVLAIIGEQRDVIIVLHVLSMALGLGAATLADFFFFKFLKDYKISQFESDVLDHVSEFIWLALACIILTGLGLYLPDAGVYLESSKFVAKMTIVGVIIANGALLNLVIAPRLVTMTFDKKHEHHHRAGEFRRHRRLAFALGPISVVSWYSAFILGSLRSLPFSSAQILGFYIVLILVGITGGQISERLLVWKASKSSHEQT